MLLKELERAAAGTKTDLKTVLDSLPYNDQGLIAAVAQDATTKDVLMLAWMNRQAIETTLRTRQVTYYSRSRQTLWRKGETSGHTQSLLEFRFDCDGDAILMRVEQAGPACHTDRPTCFYLKVEESQVVVATAPLKGS